MLLILAGVAVVLGLSGPFDTFSTMRPGPRLIYWTLVVFFTYFTGFSVSQVLSDRLGRFQLVRWLRVLLTGTGAGIAVGLVLGAFNMLALNTPVFPDVWLENMGPAIVIAIIVTALLETSQSKEAASQVSSQVSNRGAGQGVISAPQATPQSSPQVPPLPDRQTARLLDRLPLDKRGALVSLSVSDHYVNVVTTKGREMILMRLGDAIREAAPTPGLQVHRSHWVATDEVVNVRRTGETAVLTTSAGDAVPASRTYMAAVRSSGLMPRSGQAATEPDNG